MIQFSLYYLVFIFHKFAAIIIAQLYSSASIVRHNIKPCIRTKLPQSKPVALALHYLFSLELVFGIGGCKVDEPF